MAYTNYLLLEYTDGFMPYQVSVLDRLDYGIYYCSIALQMRHCFLAITFYQYADLKFKK